MEVQIEKLHCSANKKDRRNEAGVLYKLNVCDFSQNKYEEVSSIDLTIPFLKTKEDVHLFGTIVTFFLRKTLGYMKQKEAPNGH